MIIIAFKGAIQFFFTISSLRREPSPTRTLKWPGRNRVQITCNTSSAYHVQHVVLRAARYEGTAQLVSLTEFKSHLFELYFIGWTIKRWRRGGNRSTWRKLLMTSFRKCHILKPEHQAPSETRTRTIAPVAGQDSRRANRYDTRRLSSLVVFCFFFCLVMEVWSSFSCVCTVTGVNLWGCAVGMGVVVTLYTSLVSVSFVLIFCICTCSAQLSMFHTERRSRNTVVIIIYLLSLSQHGYSSS